MPTTQTPLRSAPLWLVMPVAVCLAASVGWLDYHAAEVQGTVLVLIILTATLSFAAPGRAWILAIIMGCSVEVAYLAFRSAGIPPRFPMTPSYGGLLALIPAAIGGVIGVALRRGLNDLRS